MDGRKTARRPSKPDSTSFSSSLPSPMRSTARSALTTGADKARRPKRRSAPARAVRRPSHSQILQDLEQRLDRKGLAKRRVHVDELGGAQVIDLAGAGFSGNHD